MHSKKTDGQQWSIHAEFTVSPHKVCTLGNSTPSTSSIQDKSEIRLSYSWKTNESGNISDTKQSVRNDNMCRPIEYQKGNLVFTSIPPCKFQTAAPGNNFEVHDSGYGSDLLSLNSLASGNSNNPNNPNNRKCRSTCSIVLCSNIGNKEQDSASGYLKCGRINSLRCQTPALRSTRQNANFYGCGDPWCHHIQVEKENLLSEEKVSSDVEHLEPRQIKNTSLDLTGFKPYKRDVSIQTSDSLQKCSAANLGHYKKTLKELEKTNTKHLNRNAYRYGQSAVGHAGEKLQPSSSRKHNVDKNCEISGHTSDSSKKSRTIHIDVYCTDTEIEPSETSSDSWDNDSSSTPQTVFESENTCVTHERAKESSFPFKLKKYFRRKTSTPITSIEKGDSDNDDGSSTNYPSKIDSYSTINDFSSSISSIKSWRNNSLSSFTNDGDFIDNFSKSSIYSTMDRPLLYKRENSIGKIFAKHDTHMKKFINEPYTCKNKPPQGHEKCTIKHQNAGKYDNREKTKTENKISTDIVNNEVRENKSTASNNNSFFTGTDSYRSNKAHSSIKSNEKELPHQKLTNDYTTSPQLVFYSGQFTGQIASRFGQVINLSKKLGHHTGPIKNPDCYCEHCRRYFELLS